MPVGWWRIPIITKDVKRLAIPGGSDFPREIVVHWPNVMRFKRKSKNELKMYDAVISKTLFFFTFTYLIYNSRDAKRAVSRSHRHTVLFGLCVVTASCFCLFFFFQNSNLFFEHLLRPCGSDAWATPPSPEPRCPYTARRRTVKVWWWTYAKQFTRDVRAECVNASPSRHRTRAYTHAKNGEARVEGRSRNVVSEIRDISVTSSVTIHAFVFLSKRANESFDKSRVVVAGRRPYRARGENCRKFEKKRYTIHRRW